MAKKKPLSTPAVPTIHEATLGTGGSVIKGVEITQVEAGIRRRAGLDVVVCGPSLTANRILAGLVETHANGAVKRCPPHPSAGPQSLPHFQPDPRPPDGHTFYETTNRKAV